MVAEPEGNSFIAAVGCISCSAIISRTTDQNELEFGAPDAIQPLGITEVFGLLTLKASATDGRPSHASARSAKLGLLWLNRGVWEGSPLCLVRG